MAGLWQKFKPASRREAGAPRSDIDYRLLVPLLANSTIVQAAYAIERVTTSYRVIELNLPVIWLGIIASAFAILPIFLGVWVGRFLDRGNDAQATWFGCGLLVITCSGFWWSASSVTTLLLWTFLLGISNLFLMAGQQMTCIRCSGPRGRDSVFGNYLVVNAVGQGLGPYLIAWLGGSAMLPPTNQLFAIGLVLSLVSLVTAAAIRPAPKHLMQVDGKDVESVGTLLRQRGLMAVLIASVITVTAQDLLTIYLPLLGTERGINAGDIGSLLTVRSVASMLARMGYLWVIRVIGRRPLTLLSMVGSGIGFACLALPIPLWAMFAAILVLGLSLGIAATLSLTNVVDLTSAAAMGTIMSLRITGNRIGQVVLPFAASLIATVTGIGGIFVIIAASLAASGAAVHFSDQER